MNENVEKNSLFISDINISEKSLKYKIFHYFFLKIKENKRFKTWILCFLIIIEAIQLISYAFSSIHYNSWKMEGKDIKLVSSIISIFRISPFIKLMNKNIFSLVLYLLIIFIFIISLFVTIQILFYDSSSKFYKYSSAIIWSLIDIMTIFLYIPIIEIILTPIRCVDGQVFGLSYSETCWKGIHYFQITLGILSTILLFILSIFMLNFRFCPFQKYMSTIRINSSNDIIIIVMKLFIILQRLLIKNEYISLFILLFASFIMFYSCYNESTYNNKYLEITITIKNIMIIWTYFVLFLSKLFRNYTINGFIYLLAIGYPIIIYLSIIIYKEKDMDYTFLSGNPHNLKDLLNKIRLNIKFINSYIERNKNIRNEEEGQRNSVLLKGNIKVHNMSCLNKDCPLKKFMNNEGNFNLQKQCLLNYMNIYFNRGLKKYPRNISLLLTFIYFNFSKKFNLNSVKSNLFQLKKLKCTIKESFTIYCLEQNIKKNDNDFDVNNESDKSSIEIIISQKYQKLKYLIESSIKLFGEFWGFFSTNVSNSLNTKKLYSLGEKLNKHLNEINNLWENELKNKKINIEYQSTIQLYSKFLLEILWNKQKSLEVIQKLNDENINYQENYNKQKKDKNNNCTRLEELIDNQDYILFADSDEKGNCKIIQCSLSLSHFLGYSKYDIIGNSINILLPNILIEENCKYIEEIISSLHNEQNTQKDLSYRGSESNENSKLLITKNRMGYVFPLFISFKVLDNNDYSDSFLVKLKMENKEPKTEYGYYILTKPDFSVENISSSAINLGLSLDLLKKYVVKIDILIRTIHNNSLNIYDNYNDYEEEPRKVIWVFPNIIYPKDDSLQNKDEHIDDLIRISRTKKFYMQIKAIKYNPYEVCGFFFKFTEISEKRKKIINNDIFIPNCDKNLIMFDLLKLKYFRSIVVDKKTGLRNMRYGEYGRDTIRRNSQIKQEEKNIKKLQKQKTSAIEEESSSSEDSEKKKIKNILTKEKILELQVHHFTEIKNFIFSLPIYSLDVSLEKFSPNGAKYSASKLTDSLIRMHVSSFCKRINEIHNFEQNIKMRNNNDLINNSYLNSPKSSSFNNLLISPKASSHSVPSPAPVVNQGEDINKGIISDSSSTLINLFKANSIEYIRILVFITFFSIIILIIISFIIVYKYFNNMKTKIDFLKNGFIILDDLLYTKFFVTEGILGYENKENYFPFSKEEDFISNIISELIFYKNDISEKYYVFTSNKLCDEFIQFMSNTNITIYTLTMNVKDKIKLLFKTAMDRIPASINDVAMDDVVINLKNRDIYELMHNLINEYYINWEKVIIILSNDCIKLTKIRYPLKIIIIVYCFFAVIIFIVFLKLISIFSIDRQKPINLFLTIKKRVFENLKNSADLFSNKLLNKFFGNEDNEEESQQEYQSNVQQNDINIIKFKSANEYHTLMGKENSFIEIFIGMFIFLFIYFIYFVFIYVNYKNRMDKIFQFVTFYNKVNLAHTNFLLSFNIMKSYLYDKNILILNKNHTEEQFINSFLNISQKFEDSIIYLAFTDSILNGKIINKLEMYLYDNFNELLSNESIHFLENNIPSKLKRGLKPVITRVFEIIRLINIKYFASSEIYEQKIPSDIMKEKNPQLIELNKIIQYLIRPWFSNLNNLLVDSLYEYQSSSILYYTIFFICLITMDILAYFILWKYYEEKLKQLLKGSVDLINLIPQEIKNIIAEKLNE